MVNQEINSLNENIKVALHYAERIIATIRVPLLVLDKDFNIKSANKIFYKTFSVNEGQIAGQNIFQLSNGQWDFPELRDLLQNLLPLKTKILDLEITSNFSLLGKKVLLINANEIINKLSNEKLILLAIEDVTERRLLKEKESEIQDVFTNMVIQAPFAMMVMRGFDHIIDVINEPALKLIGKSSADLVNKPIADSIPKIKSSGYINILDKVFIEGERYVATEQRFVLPHLGAKEVRYLSLVFDPFKNKEGVITGVIAVCNDVTTQVIAHKKMEENEMRFHLIADFMPEKIWTADAEGNKNYFNNRYLNFTGLPFADLKNWGWKQLIHPEDWPENEILWRASISSGEDYENMLRIRNAEGEYKWHMSRATALLDEAGHIQMWIGTKTEIQSVKEEEEKRANFIKMVSHELKTPVTSIKGYVQLLQLIIDSHPQTSLPETFTNSLERISDLINRQTRLINEMLDLSRLDSGQLEFHSTEINMLNLVTEVIEDLRLTNPKHKINFVGNKLCKVNGDKNQLEQVLVNLIGNAIKYSAEGTDVLVTVAMQDQNKVKVSVKDQGIGIDKKDQENIFDRFYRVSGKNEQTYPGFGIGLYISKETVTRHGGSFSLESEKNVGSTFSFTLPCA